MYHIYALFSDCHSTKVFYASEFKSRFWVALNSELTWYVCACRLLVQSESSRMWWNSSRQDDGPARSTAGDGCRLAKQWPTPPLFTHTAFLCGGPDEKNTGAPVPQDRPYPIQLWAQAQSNGETRQTYGQQSNERAKGLGEGLREREGRPKK